MSDPRTTPDPDLVQLSKPMQIKSSIADLHRAPTGPRDRQLIYGEHVTVLQEAGNWQLVRAEKDGYCGYVRSDVLGLQTNATHIVTARSSQAYEAADIKSADQIALSLGSRVTAQSETATFVETELGFIPRQHLHRVSDFAIDPVAIASLFLGTPYLWGGNSAWGIDCSGLVQAACLMCNMPCPGDSDQQFDHLGDFVTEGTDYIRGDLLFWKGHVAFVSSPTVMLHANAGHMAVAEEDIKTGIARIAAQGDGPVTAHKRLVLPTG
ncbi:NlpC/P60 family protein [uncultured Roseobacter sp.]|uniref:C40 family peptidase n=1 Tax=uncultured Roseobacter sp. TaxID=114847 RepID=UPI0026150B83|nr:NlpC/P60 family protein [uncultured Roseobacter sp.]